MIRLYISSDTLVELTGLVDADGTAIGDATITFDLEDEAGNTILTAQPFSLVAGSTNDYRATCPAGTTLVAGKPYFVLVPISTPAGDDYRRVRAVAEYRGET